jgi:hypothetical protein
MKAEFSKNTQILNFMEVRPVGAELFRANRGENGRADRHAEANSLFAILRTHLKTHSSLLFGVARISEMLEKL